MAVLGGALTAATLTAFSGALFLLELPTEAAVTVAFVTLALGQLWNVFNVRAPGSKVFRNDIVGNPYVWAALLLCSGLIAAAVALPPLAAVLSLSYPGQDGMWLSLGCSLMPLLIGQVTVARSREA
jgi:Ca2+-transporting ATPase